MYLVMEERRGKTEEGEKGINCKRKDKRIRKWTEIEEKNQNRR